MYIERNGVKIELTPEELRLAHEEYEYEKGVHKEIYEKAFIDFNKLADIVDDFEGSFDELCIKLGGQNFDGELFDVNYGVLSATIKNVGAARWVSTQSIDIWDKSMDSMIEKCISLSKLKEICIGLGVNVDNISYDNEPGFETEVIKATTISFTTNEGPDTTQFDTQDQAEVLELLGQLLQENNLELVSIDSIESCEIVEKVPRVASVDELLDNAKQTCENLNKNTVTKNDVDLGKE